MGQTNEEDVFFKANSEASQPHLSVETLAVKGTIPLTARGDLTRELDLLLERGITPPQPPPRRASGPLGNKMSSSSSSSPSSPSSS